MTWDPDNYESDESQASTASTTAGVKFYQIEVPNFLEQPAPAGVPVPTNYVDTDGKTPVTTTPTGTPVALPSFSSTNAASSFLRLGSSPASGDWTQALYKNSVNLARLVADPVAIAASENVSLSTTSAPTALVGNVDNPSSSTLVYSPPATYYSLGQATTAAQPTSVTFQDAFVDGTGPTEGTPFGGGTAFGSAQDPNFLLGFADDTRWRGTPESSETVNDTSNNLSTNNNILNPTSTLISNVAVPNVNANRQAETLKLLSKGGWWDHSDGNRVTTTSGDKIEVIQGNYKLVVLGRQPAPVAPAITNTVDMQALLRACSNLSNTTYDLLTQLKSWYDAQTSATLAAVQTALDHYTSWGQSPDAKPAVADVTAKFQYQVQVWLTTQNSFITDLSGGHFQEQYPSPTPCIKTVEYSLDNNNEWTLYQDNTQGNLITRLKGKTVDLFQGSSRESYVGTSSTTALYASGAATGTTSADLRLDPMVASYTWAQSVYSQTGSSDKPIGYGAGSDNPSTKSAAGGGPQPAGVNKGDVVSKTWADRVISETYGNTKVTSKTEVSNTTVYSEINNDGAGGATLGNIINMTKTGSITSLTAAFHIMDMSIALRTAIAVGFGRDIYLGGKLSLTVGSFYDIRLGGKTEITNNATTSINLGAGEDLTLAGKLLLAPAILIGM